MGNLYRHKSITFLKAEEMKEFSSGHVKKTVQVLQDLRLFWSKYFPSRPYEMFISLSGRMVGHLVQEQANPAAYHGCHCLLPGCCCFPSNKMDAGQSDFTKLSGTSPLYLCALFPRNQ